MTKHMTKADLRDHIDDAKRSLAFADMIDSFSRRQSEMQYWRQRIAQLEAALAEAEAADPINLAGSGPTPIEERQ